MPRSSLSKAVETSKSSIRVAIYQLQNGHQKAQIAKVSVKWSARKEDCLYVCRGKDENVQAKEETAVKRDFQELLN